MKGGFSFCGIDIADIGLEYAPENKDTYVYKPTEAEVHEEVFEGHHGGYVYGATKQPKEFILRCFYEQKHISKGVMAKAYNLFKVGKSGILVFKRRPWCYYYATVTAVDNSEMYNYLNGLFVVTMKAYYPFARSLDFNGKTLFALPDNQFNGQFPDYPEIMKNSAILEHEYMLPAMSFEDSVPNSIILYNPGTERASVGIVISGTAGDEGVSITNRTTGQSCRYIGFDTEDNEEIFTDGINGKTIITRDGNKSLAFLYHDYGFIELEPAFPIVRNLFVTYSGTNVSSSNFFYHDEEERLWYTGKYIYLDGWYKISECTDKHSLVLETAAGSGSCKTDVVLMNEIILVPSQGTDIKKLSFIYKPTFA